MGLCNTAAGRHILSLHINGGEGGHKYTMICYTGRKEDLIGQCNNWPFKFRSGLLVVAEGDEYAGLLLFLRGCFGAVRHYGVST
jgi:hypothetical protein